MELTWPCPHCRHWQNATVQLPLSPPSCSECKRTQFETAGSAFLERGEIHHCYACGSKHLYRQRDFNRKLGIGLLVAGVLLAYWTYGISLLVVTVIDFLLFRFVGEVGCCYRCQAQIRKASAVDKIPPFDLKLHDYYRSLK